MGMQPLSGENFHAANSLQAAEKSGRRQLATPSLIWLPMRRAFVVEHFYISNDGDPRAHFGKVEKPARTEGVRVEIDV